MKTIKTTIATVLILMSVKSYSQEKPTHKIVNNEIIKIEKEETVEKTNLRHRIGDTITEVFRSKNGRLFIIKTSKKTGKKYKYYFNI